MKKIFRTLKKATISFLIMFILCSNVNGLKTLPHSNPVSVLSSPSLFDETNTF